MIRVCDATPWDLFPCESPCIFKQHRCVVKPDDRQRTIANVMGVWGASWTSHAGQVMLKMVATCLGIYLNNHGLLPEEQCEFRPG